MEQNLEKDEIMGNHPHTPVDVDPQVLAETRAFWAGFTCLAKYSIIAIVVILAGMAFFLV